MDGLSQQSGVQLEQLGAAPTPQKQKPTKEFVIKDIPAISEIERIVTTFGRGTGFDEVFDPENGFTSEHISDANTLEQVKDIAKQLNILASGQELSLDGPVTVKTSEEVEPKHTFTGGKAKALQKRQITINLKNESGEVYSVILEQKIPTFDVNPKTGQPLPPTIIHSKRERDAQKDVAQNAASIGNLTTETTAAETSRLQENLEKFSPLPLTSKDIAKIDDSMLQRTLNNKLEKKVTLAALKTLEYSTVEYRKEPSNDGGYRYIRMVVSPKLHGRLLIIGLEADSRLRDGDKTITDQSIYSKLSIINNTAQECFSKGANKTSGLKSMGTSCQQLQKEPFNELRKRNSEDLEKLFYHASSDAQSCANKSAVKRLEASEWLDQKADEKELEKEELIQEMDAAIHTITPHLQSAIDTNLEIDQLKKERVGKTGDERQEITDKITELKKQVSEKLISGDGLELPSSISLEEVLEYMEMGREVNALESEAKALLAQSDKILYAYKSKNGLKKNDNIKYGVVLQDTAKLLMGGRETYDMLRDQGNSSFDAHVKVFMNEQSRLKSAATRIGSSLMNPTQKNTVTPSLIRFAGHVGQALAEIDTEGKIHGGNITPSDQDLASTTDLRKASGNPFTRIARETEHLERKALNLFGQTSTVAQHAELKVQELHKIVSKSSSPEELKNARNLFEKTGHALHEELRELVDERITELQKQKQSEEEIATKILSSLNGSGTIGKLADALKKVQHEETRLLMKETTSETQKHQEEQKALKAEHKEAIKELKEKQKLELESFKTNESNKDDFDQKLSEFKSKQKEALAELKQSQGIAKYQSQKGQRKKLTQLEVREQILNKGMMDTFAFHAVQKVTGNTPQSSVGYEILKEYALNLSNEEVDGVDYNFLNSISSQNLGTELQNNVDQFADSAKETLDKLTKQKTPAQKPEFSTEEKKALAEKAVSTLKNESINTDALTTLLQAEVTKKRARPDESILVEAEKQAPALLGTKAIFTKEIQPELKEKIETFTKEALSNVSCSPPENNPITFLNDDGTQMETKNNQVINWQTISDGIQERIRSKPTEKALIESEVIEFLKEILPEEQHENALEGLDFIFESARKDAGNQIKLAIQNSDNDDFLPEPKSELVDYDAAITALKEQLVKDVDKGPIDLEKTLEKLSAPPASEKGLKTVNAAATEALKEYRDISNAQLLPTSSEDDLKKDVNEILGNRGLAINSFAGDAIGKVMSEAVNKALTLNDPDLTTQKGRELLITNTQKKCNGSAIEATLKEGYRSGNGTQLNLSELENRDNTYQASVYEQTAEAYLLVILKGKGKINEAEVSLAKGDLESDTIKSKFEVKTSCENAISSIQKQFEPKLKEKNEAIATDKETFKLKNEEHEEKLRKAKETLTQKTTEFDSPRTQEQEHELKKLTENVTELEKPNPEIQVLTQKIKKEEAEIAALEVKIESIKSNDKFETKIADMMAEKRRIPNSRLDKTSIAKLIKETCPGLDDADKKNLDENFKKAATQLCHNMKAK